MKFKPEAVMLEITNQKLFAEVVEAAKRKVGGEARWVAAIDRAVEEIAADPTFFHWTGHSMLIQSAASAEVYEANGNCQCPAYGFHKPCWHRSAYKLWKRYLEALASPARAARTEETAVLVAPAVRKVERAGAFQI
jgi:hypothetical protein